MNRSKTNPAADSIQGPWLMRHSALAYVNQWFVTDRRFMSELRTKQSGLIDSTVLGELAAKYMVARGFKKPTQVDGATTEPLDRRWIEAAAQLDRVLTAAPLSDVEVHLLAERLAKVAPRERTPANELLSAATKFLWFSGCQDIRILDARAVDALIRLGASRSLGKRYDSYAAAWQEQFNAHREELRAAIDGLARQLDWTLIPSAFHDETVMVLRSSWFADRVFDKYLWTIGEGAATGFV